MSTVIEKNTMSLSEFFDQTQEVMTAIKVAVYSFFAYLGIDTNVVEILFILMCVDTMLGGAKAVRLGQQFSFKKLLWGMVTKLSVLVIPMVIALVAKGLSFDFKWFVLAILNILIVAEGFSAISNILSIKTKKHVENVDFISMMLKTIRKGLASVASKMLSGIQSGTEDESDDTNLDDPIIKDENDQ